MQQDLSNHRKTYQKQELLESNCPENPIELFKKWFLNADESEMISEANAMTVSSIGLDGIAVLFTNTDSGSFSNERENDCPEDIKFTAS